MAQVRFKTKEETNNRVASNQSILLRSLLMPTTMATLTGTALRTLGMVFGIPPHNKNGYYQKRVRKKEKLSVY